VSETISLEWIRTTPRKLRAEQRSIRVENELIRNTLNAQRSTRLLMQRIGEFEARVHVRLDQQRREVVGRLDPAKSLKMLVR